MNTTERIAWFSKLWKHISNIFPYFDRRSIDLDRIYADYITAILAAESDREFCLLISEFMNLLGDGHTDFSFPPEMREEIGFLPFALIHISGTYHICAIEPDGAAHLWAEVKGINSESMESLLSRAFRYIYHTDRYAYPSKLHAILPFLLRRSDNCMETSAGTYRFDLRSVRPSYDAPHPVETGIPFSPIGDGKLEMRLYEGSRLYVNLPDLMYNGAANEIRSAMEQCGDLRGVILDLRENMGGMTVYGARIAELFLSGPIHGCQKRTRITKGLDISSASQFEGLNDETVENYITNGLCDREEVERCRRINAGTLFDEYVDSFGGDAHRALYDGPCVLLTSRNTISAAEDLTAMFRSNHRAVIVGTATHGSTGTPLLLPLPIGGGARVCSVGYRLLDGTEFVGCGIQPDLFAENSIDDLRSGYDSVLRKALSL